MTKRNKQIIGLLLVAPACSVVLWGLGGLLFEAFTYNPELLIPMVVTLAAIVGIRVLLSSVED